MATSHVLIAIGSNLGDRCAYISGAVAALAQHGVVTAQAPIFETLPFGAKAEGLFLNTAVTFATALEPEAMMRALAAIETAAGRVRTVKWGNRTLDLDIILWLDATGQSLAITTETVIVPQPECLDREFVLEPASANAAE